MNIHGKMGGKVPRDGLNNLVRSLENGMGISDSRRHMNIVKGHPNMVA